MSGSGEINAAPMNASGRRARFTARGLHAEARARRLDRLAEAAAALRVALRDGGGVEQPVARRAAAGDAARGEDLHAQIDELVRAQVDLRELAVEAVERRVEGHVRAAPRHGQVESDWHGHAGQRRAAHARVAL